VKRAAEEQRRWLEDDVKKSKGQKLSAEERRLLSRVSLDWMWGMARGELTGYDLRPAQSEIVHALRSDDTAVAALEVLGRLPGADAQQYLAAYASDAKRGKLRAAAAAELNRHLQKYGLALTADQVGRLRKIHDDPGEDPNLRAQLALVIGRLRATTQQTGERLFQFNPNVPAPK